MKMRTLCGVVLWIGATLAAPLTASDISWLQPGIRPWYFGSTQKVADEPPPSAPVATAFLIKDLQGDAVNMTQYTWSPSLVSTSWLGFTSGPVATRTKDEGPFWALPSRLLPLQAGAEFTWQGRKRTVSEHGAVGPDKVPVALLPARAMFQLTGTRDILWLRAEKEDGKPDESTLFDVETGILLYHSVLDDKSKLFLCLAEMNYDFAAKAGFQEDAGLHTSFAGVFGGSTLGAGAFMFHSQVQTRYKDEVVVNIISVLTGGGSQMSFKNHLLYFNGRGEARITESALTPPPIEQWQVCGDHNFWWIPVPDLAQTSLKTWGTTLHRANLVNGRTTFSTREIPAEPGLKSLTFDSRGFLCDMILQNVSLGILVDTAGFCFNRRADIMGPAEYAGMTRAGPAGGHASGPGKTNLHSVALSLGPLEAGSAARPAATERARGKAQVSGLPALRAEYEAARADIEQMNSQKTEQVTNVADLVVVGHANRERVRQLDKHYMDVLNQMQKNATSSALFSEIDAEKMRVWKIVDGADR